MSYENKEIYTNEPKRIWKQGNNPYRSIVFWGWNNTNEPSFLILYGIHDFKEKKSYYVDGSDVERFENVLDDYVTYTSYNILNGREGHLPSFEAVNIVEDGGYYNRDKQHEFPKMYYKKDSRSDGWSRKLNDDGIVKEYKKFDEGYGIKIPYFEEFSYSELVNMVLNSGMVFENFRFAEDPNDILNIPENLNDYYELLCIMMSNKNLYTRKKKLIELLEVCKNTDIYKYIFKFGSTELLSGLFLESAKREIKEFIDEAQFIHKENIHYSEISYVQGLKRCAEIYLNSVNKEKRREREKWIKNNICNIDLNIIKLDNKEIPQGQTLNGSRYRKLSLQEKLKEYNGHYERKENGGWDFVRVRFKDRYKKGPFNDGVVFDIKAFKNTIQEAEAYKMADVIGKIAYYLDAPRLHYYFKGNSLNKELNYFKRYVRRIIESYSENDPEKFMEAVTSLFTSYTEDDFLCKFKGNFQFNYYIKNLLYFDFKEKPPIGWDNWRERSDWMENDQLLKLNGRYEYRKDIWDNHLEKVLYIASNAQINVILKACYFILKESEKTIDLIEKMNYRDIIKAANSAYEPLAKMFKEVLERKLDKEIIFDFSIMSDLMNNDNKDINNLSMEYFKRTNGYITSNNILELMFFDDLEKWTEYIKFNINSIDPHKYGEFIKAFICSDDRFKDSSINLTEEIINTISESVKKVMDMTYAEKSEILRNLITLILEKGSMELFIEKYIEEVIFAFSNSEIKGILIDFTFDKNRSLSSRNNMLLNLIDSIVNDRIPSDSTIIKVLEIGTSKCLKTLFEILTINEKELIVRHSTMLILFECDVLILNEKAKEIFYLMGEESRIIMHKMIIDSPIEKVHNFGLEKLKEIYGDFVPSEFIMQMLEHPSEQIKGYIANKSNAILNSLGQGNEDLFMYYAKTLLFLPNKVRKNKDYIYEALYNFSNKYKGRICEVEELLLNMGGSNIIKDKEKALVTLAKIRKERVV
ncbi:hypothetical protein LJE39_17930 [Clostridium butyricum]|uniref:hypothetical protein n=2 Tax=Clostridium butyricum TaxID=1492 RepID=UPI0018AB1388|nr:hypothetical protein [Clostridium butyricum]MCQ2015024.1 hypothetical protein [Clostridium butyricum]